MKNELPILLLLIREGLHLHNSRRGLFDATEINWDAVFSLAILQGVTSISMDGLNRLLNDNTISIELMPSQIQKLQYIGMTMEIENKYNQQHNRAEVFINKLAEKGISCYVLKGFSFSQYYLIPEHRESGDFDCYLSSSYEWVNKHIDEIGGWLESEDYKHAHIEFKGLTIENHKFLIQTRDGRKHKKFEKFLKSLIESNGYTNIQGTKLISPCPLFNSLFLIEHAAHHFLFEKITLRFVCDWACLLDKCQDEIDWNEFNYWIDEMGYHHFVGIMTSLAVDYLGLELKYKCIPFERKHADLVLNDMVAENACESYLTASKNVRMSILFGRYKNLWKYHKIFHRSATVELLYMAKEYILN